MKIIRSSCLEDETERRIRTCIGLQFFCQFPLGLYTSLHHSSYESQTSKDSREKVLKTLPFSPESQKGKETNGGGKKIETRHFEYPIKSILSRLGPRNRQEFFINNLLTNLGTFLLD